MAVQREQAQKVSEAAKSLQSTHAAKMAANRAVFEVERDKLAKTQQVESEQLKAAWKQRTIERATAMGEIIAKAEASKKMRADHAVSRRHDSDARSELLDAYAEQVKYDQAARRAAAEQDNKLDQDWDIADDD